MYAPLPLAGARSVNSRLTREASTRWILENTGGSPRSNNVQTETAGSLCALVVALDPRYAYAVLCPSVRCWYRPCGPPGGVWGLGAAALAA